MGAAELARDLLAVANLWAWRAESALEVALRDRMGGDRGSIEAMNAFPESVALRDRGRALLPGSRVLV